MPANLENSAVASFPNWKRDWKRSVFIPIPKKGNAKKCSNYSTIALISHTSKVMLKILQARLQQYVNCELPDVFPADILVRLLISCCPPGGGHSHHLGFSGESFLFSPLGPSVSSMIPLFGLIPHTGSIQPLVDS